MGRAVILTKQRTDAALPACRFQKLPLLCQTYRNPSLHTHVSEQELNLFELACGEMAQVARRCAEDHAEQRSVTRTPKRHA